MLGRYRSDIEIATQSILIYLCKQESPISRACPELVEG